MDPKLDDEHIARVAALGRGTTMVKSDHGSLEELTGITAPATRSGPVQGPV